MPPKKKTTTLVVSSDKKPIRRRRKYVAKKSSKVYKGEDIAISCIKDVKPATRVLKRKVTQNKIEVDYNEQTASENAQSPTSNNNQPVAKKRRITRKLEIESSMVTRNNKKCQVQKKERKEGDSKSKILTLNHKVIPKNLKIVRTVVNDYVPDEVALENDENSVMLTTNSSTESIEVTKDVSHKKLPIIILKKLVINDNSKLILEEGSKKTSENNLSNTTNGQSNCDNNLDLSSHTLSQDISTIGGPCQTLGLDRLFFLDHYTSVLHQFTGYSLKNNVDFSKKKLDLNIQTEELKNVTCGGIIQSDTISHYDNKVSISLKTDEKKVNRTPEPNTKEQILQARKEASEYDPDSSNRLNYTDDDDDDDTISLYAESLSGFETNSKTTHSSNIYEPIVDKRDETCIFKIPKPIVLKPCIQVCEKQKADSTSVGLLEISNPKVDCQNIEYAEPEIKLDNKITTETTKSCTSSPVLPESQTPVRLVNSSIFKGICVFNLMKNCKNKNCNFPHTIPRANFVSEKLLELTEDQFEQECLMVCKKGHLLRVYGLLYINEGIHRQNNRMVIEITLSYLKFFDHTQEKQMITEVVERTLLYLNQVNLNEFSDLLNFEFKSGVQVCDKFMEVIGQTQNFSRFKIVFVKLTMLMCRRNRTFDSDVASQILERLCILPYSFDLARALIDILKRTDVAVFCNPMIKVFEKKLMKCDNELLKEFFNLQEQSSRKSKRIDDGDTKRNISDKAIRYSPDTTNKDSLDRHEHNMEVRQADQSQQSIPRRSLPYPKFYQGSPGSNRFPSPPYRRQVNYGPSPSLRPQMNPRQRWPSCHPRPRIPAKMRLSFPLRQNTPRRNSNGPYG